MAGAPTSRLIALDSELLLAVCAKLDAVDVARLRGACRALHDCCAEPALWRAKLAERFGDEPADERAAAEHPARTYARRAVCARWGLRNSSPKADNRPPSPENAQLVVDLSSRVRALRLGATPDARKTLSRLDLNASGATPPFVGRGGSSSRGGGSDGGGSSGSPVCAAGAPFTPTAALDAVLQKRLSRDLLDIVAAAPGGVSAFPAQEDMLLWYATVSGVVGRPDEQTTFKLVLSFGPKARAEVRGAEEEALLARAHAKARRAGRRLTPRTAAAMLEIAARAEDADEAMLPSVRLASPAVKHPNVAPDGRVCAHALNSRGDPANTVRVLLLKVQQLLDRPHLGVRPLNKAAALEYVEALSPASIVAPAQCSAIAGSSAFPPQRPSSLALLSPPDLNRASPTGSSCAGTPATASGAAGEGAPPTPVPLPFLLWQ
ncbi:hypothetical protein T492DRAFT_874773 [Pavlovales sp. CCMP2436]|nr:hypothetical protein T492DRAFT_874773 [Pavlovales sp. CCMP2436]